MLQSRSLRFAVPVLVAALAAGGCAGSKSANPLSPSVAGPIPGVDITAPRPINPTGGMKVATDQQPITLTVENATTNGPRALSYVFEIATDAGFTTTVFVREGITPGEGSSTSLRLPDPLATERAYYWRARAQDGANTGPYSSAASFNVVTPIVIGQPMPISPGPNAVLTSTRPKLVFANAPRSGPAGPITYLVEIATTDTFGNKVAFNVGEQPSQTSTDVAQDLSFNSYYFWHVRASDPTTTGPWSATQAFLTPSAPAAPTTPTAPNPGGSAPPDAIDLSQAIVHNSPQDVARWAPTSTLTRLDLMPSGVHIESTKQDAWPEVVPPGWSGGLQYTLWIVLKINGEWHTSGCIEYWRGLYESGGPVTQYAQDWYYDPIRWGPMAGHQPAVGEQVGFFITAGDARNNGLFSVKERSNVVIVPFPTSGGARFTF
jgi:hypothetical protein